MTKIQIHRIMEWQGLERTSGDLLVQPSWLKQGHLEQVAQQDAQVGFESLQKRRIYNISGQSTPVFCHTHRKKVFS